jgi:fatty-acid desaturase
MLTMNLFEVLGCKATATDKDNSNIQKHLTNCSTNIVAQIANWIIIISFFFGDFLANSVIVVILVIVVIGYIAATVAFGTSLGS